MRATTPQHALGSNSGKLPAYLYPVGTSFPHHLLVKDASDEGYYIKLMMKQAESDMRKILRSLRRGGYSSPLKGRKIPAYNQAQLDEIRDMITHPDSVEIAGHAPRSMHVVGSIANECYVPGVPGAASGVEWELYLLFRKVVKGNKVVYLHPYPVYDERRLAGNLGDSLRPRT